jgi:hypothetical protein
MTLLWIIFGALLGNVCWWSALYVFAIRPNDRSMAASTKAGVVAMLAVVVVCALGYIAFPDARI